MRCLRRIFFAACLALAGLVPAHAASVLVVVSEPRGVYMEFADAIKTELQRGNQHEVNVIDSDLLATRGGFDPQLVLAVGGKAVNTVLGREIRTPVLLTLIPRSSYDKLPAARRDDRRISAVFVDQPPNRYLDLVKAALPNIDRIGLLAGRDSREHVARLSAVARERKLRPMTEPVNTDADIYPALQRMFSEGGAALLATPDTSVFNSQTIPNIILSTYRFRVPVVGFSPAYVRSGALVAIYSTPAQLATQSSDIARGILNGGQVPLVQYPRIYSIGINNVAARSLGFDLDTEAVIRERMERMERSTP
ncbi:MAG: ABC transporter substrate binding protein [Rhodocyclaceae bacterium]